MFDILHVKQGARFARIMALLHLMAFTALNYSRIARVTLHRPGNVGFHSDIGCVSNAPTLGAWIAHEQIITKGWQ